MEDNTFDLMKFDLPKDHSSIIKVIGVGGGGSNAVNYMYEQGINGVDFIVCNTDEQALDKSPVPTKIQLGATLTEGKGAGSIPEVGRNAAVENLDDVKALLEKNTTMVFVTAGMGGGTGTGAAPIIAKAAKEMGILTVGIVTIPFLFEGRKRSTQAQEGLQEMRDAVDTLLVIRNDKLRELYGNLTLNKAFSHADEVLCTAAKGIAEVITLTGEINVDMNDVKTVMSESGVAIMGSGVASGEGRAMKAVSKALESPLLNDNDIRGARFVLLNITYGAEEVLMDEIMEITDHIQEMAGMTAEVIWGYGSDKSLEENLCVTVIATGFEAHQVDAGLPVKEPEVTRFKLEESDAREVTDRLDISTKSPVQPVNLEKDDYVDVSPEDAEEPYIKESSEEVQVDMFSMSKGEEEIAHDQDAEVSDELNFTIKEENSQEEEEEEKVEEVQAERKIYKLDEDELSDDREEPEISDLKITGDRSSSPISEDRPDKDILIKRNKEREQKIKELTLKLKTPSGLSELEAEPAYKRKNVQLDNVPHSSESTISRYTLNEETNEKGEKKVEIKPNNPFLHDNVD
jgi:cell division protein FtsZ